MRKISWIVLVLALIAIGSMPVVMAQAPAAQGYVVQQGDNLWKLSGDYLGNPVKWGEVLGANPFLKEPGRQFQAPDGRIIVLIKPGERLNGIANLGVTAEPVPISELKPATVTVAPVEKKAEATPSFWSGGWVFPGPLSFSLHCLWKPGVVSRTQPRRERPSCKAAFAPNTRMQSKSGSSGSPSGDSRKPIRMRISRRTGQCESVPSRKASSTGTAVCSTGAVCPNCGEW